MARVRPNGGYRTADYSLMREMNLTLILECLHQDAPLSRAQLARMTGLNKATVSSLVRELSEARFVHESGVEEGDKGRPATNLELNPNAGCLIGAEIGVDSISVLLADFSIRPLWQHREQTAPTQSQAAILGRTLDILREADAQARQAGAPVLGLGLGVPGLMDVSSGTLLFAPNLHWEGVPLRQRLEAEFSFPIYVDNDANMAALGESYFGAARGADFVLYVAAGVGLGSGIVLNHRVLSGASGLAGEVGHMTLNPDGPRCNCGSYGCWETYGSQWALFRRIREAVAAGQASSLAELVRGDEAALTVPQVVEAARAGDTVAQKALEETGASLGLGLANLINALNPRRVVVGGTLSLAHEFILPAIRQVVERRALRWSHEAAEIVIAAYQQEACVIGGVATVYHHILAQPLNVRRSLAQAGGARIR